MRSLLVSPVVPNAFAGQTTVSPPDEVVESVVDWVDEEMSTVFPDVTLCREHDSVATMSLKLDAASAQLFGQMGILEAALGWAKPSAVISKTIVHNILTDRI